MDKTNIILSAETQFAREVTLGVIYQLPLPLWYSLIPGMFLFDFLRRNRAISNFTKHYLFPRKSALPAAQSILNGVKKSSVTGRIENEIKKKLNALYISSPDLVKAYHNLVQLLIDHYKKLLCAEGNTYEDLVENAYTRRSSFEAFINKLEKAENRLARIMIEKAPAGKKLEQRINVESEQLRLRRNKILENIF